MWRSRGFYQGEIRQSVIGAEWVEEGTTAETKIKRVFDLRKHSEEYVKLSASPRCLVNLCVLERIGGT